MTQRAPFGRSLAGTLLTVAAIAACASGKATQSAVLPAVPGDVVVDAQPVDLYDLTGLVTELEVPDDQPRLVEAPVLRLTNAGFTVAWLGGACEDGTRITFGRDGVRFVVRVESARALLSLPFGCPGLGIPRGVHIHTRFPMDMDLMALVVVPT